MNNTEEEDVSGFAYQSDAPSHTSAYLLPTLLGELGRLRTGATKANDTRVFEVGCGNGANARVLTDRGWEVTGIDPSTTGIALANRRYPDLKLYEASAYDDLAARFGQFPAVISLEVVEHLYFPRRFAATLFSLVAPGGTVIVSTPYHGYLKNLALALSGQLDSHFTALWDYGHIKFWSTKTLGVLLREAGFVDLRFLRVGRIPPLARSMVAVARRPA